MALSKITKLFGKKEPQGKVPDVPSYNTELVKTLEETVYQVKLSSEYLFSGWESVEEALGEILPLLEKVKGNDKSALQELKMLFAPTGKLQELAIDNGWKETYLELAARFDAQAGV